jgi:WhiB family redox-sensing transcriptional regulator
VVMAAAAPGGALLDQNWRALASCAQIDPDLFFAVGAREHKQAKKICRACPVRRECLAYAMDEPVDHGIWGGMTERERRRYRRQAGPAGWRSLLGA